VKLLGCLTSTEHLVLIYMLCPFVMSKIWGVFRWLQNPPTWWVQAYLKHMLHFDCLKFLNWFQDYCVYIWTGCPEGSQLPDVQCLHWFHKEKVRVVWGLHWEHGTHQCAILRAVSLGERKKERESSGAALYCNWNNFMLCASPVDKYRCSPEISVLSYHTTVTSHNSDVSFSTS
jgi:hypothetical protein